MRSDLRHHVRVPAYIGARIRVECMMADGYVLGEALFS